VVASILWFLAQVEEEAEPVNDPKDLYPHWEELLVGALAFAVLFYFMWKWVLPRVSALLQERRDKIQGDLERAEETRRQAEQELAGYRQQLANARDVAGRLDAAREAQRHLLDSIRTRSAAVPRSGLGADPLAGRFADEVSRGTGQR